MKEGDWIIIDLEARYCKMVQLIKVIPEDVVFYDEWVVEPGEFRKLGWAQMRVHEMETMIAGEALNFHKVIKILWKIK
jgi:hypothetical protein